MRMEQMFEEIKLFVERAGAHIGVNSWFSCTQMEVYLRLSWRILNDGKMHRCLDIGNISIPPRYRSKRYFSRLLEFLEGLSTEYVYIENVLSPVIDSYCERHKWEIHCDVYVYGFPCSYYKETRWHIQECADTPENEQNNDTL